MPNHVLNILYIKAPNNIDDKSIFDSIKNEKKEIDFRLIVPRPATLCIEESSDLSESLKSIPSQNTSSERYERCVRLANIARYNKEKYGYYTWYEWDINNWGTKWNAYESYYADGCAFFQTAYNAPKPIIKALSEKFPDTSFRLCYADEDIGYNCGYLEYLNGEIVDEDAFVAGSEESIRFAKELWGED